MAAGDVHRELTVAGEPFCWLLGITVRQKNPFVLKNSLALSIHGLTLVYCTHLCLKYCIIKSLLSHKTMK